MLSKANHDKFHEILVRLWNSRLIKRTTSSSVSLYYNQLQERGFRSWRLAALKSESIIKMCIFLLCFRNNGYFFENHKKLHIFLHFYLFLCSKFKLWVGFPRKCMKVRASHFFWLYYCIIRVEERRSRKYS